MKQERVISISAMFSTEEEFTNFYNSLREKVKEVKGTISTFISKPIED